MNSKQSISYFITSLLIFLIIWSVYAFSPNRTSGDSRWMIYTTMSIIKEQNIDLNEYDKVLQTNDYYAIENIKGYAYNFFPIGTCFLSLPLVYLTNQYFSFQDQDFNEYIQQHKPDQIEIGIASFFVALAGIFIFLISQEQGLSLKQQLLIIFIYAFCTSTWSTASRALWSHGPNLLLLSLILWSSLKSKISPYFLIMTGFTLGFSYLVRPTNLLSMIGFSVWILFAHRKHFLWFGIFLALPIILFLILNLQIYGHWLPPYYQQTINLHANFWPALLAHLISPGRGLFMYSPILLFSLWGILLKIKAKKWKSLDSSIVFIVITHWILITAYPKWWAGHAYGPRFFSDMIPFFIYFLADFINDLKYQSKPVHFIFYFFIMISFLIHYQGATNWNTWLWNVEPNNIDDHTERVWDWKDPAFLR